MKEALATRPIPVVDAAPLAGAVESDESRAARRAERRAARRSQ